MSDTCQSCGNPEAQHKWLNESELCLWIPEPGFKKNSCARRPSSASTEDLPVLEFKVWSPPRVSQEILPCPFCGCRETEEVMNDSEVSLECLHCHAHGPWVSEVMEDPIEAWNSRYGKPKENRQ